MQVSNCNAFTATNSSVCQDQANGGSVISFHQRETKVKDNLSMIVGVFGLGAHFLSFLPYPELCKLRLINRSIKQVIDCDEPHIIEKARNRYRVSFSNLLYAKESDEVNLSCEELSNYLSGNADEDITIKKITLDSSKVGKNLKVTHIDGVSDKNNIYAGKLDDGNRFVIIFSEFTLIDGRLHIHFPVEGAAAYIANNYSEIIELIKQRQDQLPQHIERILGEEKRRYY